MRVLSVGLLGAVIRTLVGCPAASGVLHFSLEHFYGGSTMEFLLKKLRRCVSNGWTASGGELHGMVPHISFLLVLCDSCPSYLLLHLQHLYQKCDVTLIKSCMIPQSIPCLIWLFASFGYPPDFTCHFPKSHIRAHKTNCRPKKFRQRV